MTDNTASPGSSGAGQQTPTDSNSPFEVAEFIVKQLMAKLDVMKLGQITAVHGGAGAIDKAGTVDVQLLVSQLDGAGNATPQGIVYGIPWSRMQGGKNALICDPEVGDIGYISCADRDISNVKSAVTNGKSPKVNPGSYRIYSVSDGVWVGGCLNVAPEQYIVFTATGIRIVDKSGNSVAMTATGMTLTDSVGNVIKMASDGITATPKAGLLFTVDGNSVLKGNVQIQGMIQSVAGGTYDHDITTTGNVIANGVGLTTHIHTQTPDSHGDTEQPTSIGTG